MIRIARSPVVTACSSSSGGFIPPRQRANRYEGRERGCAPPSGALLGLEVLLDLAGGVVVRVTRPPAGYSSERELALSRAERRAAGSADPGDNERPMPLEPVTDDHPMTALANDGVRPLRDPIPNEVAAHPEVDCQADEDQ